MTTGSKRAGKIAVLLAAMCVAGCDDAQHQADREVRQSLAEARLKSASGDESVHQILDQAAKNQDASPAVRAQAKAALAQAELETARAATPRINLSELELTRVLTEISQLNDQIRGSSAAVVAYRGYDPKNVRETIAAKVVEAKGGPGKETWFTYQDTSFPTLSAIQQDVARQQGDLSQRNEQMNGLTQRRTDLINQAEQAATQADTLKGEQALDTFKHSSDLRKQAADLAVQIDTLRFAISGAEHSLSIAQGQLAAVNDIINQLQDQSVTLDKAWKDIDAQATQQQQLSQQILGTPSAAPVGDQPAAATVSKTLSEKLVDVARLEKEVQALRSDTETNANNASTFFDEAYNLANSAMIELRQRMSDPKSTGRPEVDVWKTAVNALNPLQYRLQKASAQRLLGELYTSEAASLTRRIAMRENVNQSLRDAGLTPPPQLQAGDLAGDRQTAIKNADDAFKTSDDLLTDLIDGSATEDMKTIAHIGHALTSYDWAQLARLTADEGKAKDRIANATKERNIAAEANLAMVPVMPAELGPIPKPVAPAPEGAPATAPTDAAAATAAAPADATTAPTEATTTPAPAPAAQ